MLGIIWKQGIGRTSLNSIKDSFLHNYPSDYDKDKVVVLTAVEKAMLGNWCCVWFLILLKLPIRIACMVDQPTMHFCHRVILEVVTFETR